MSSKSSDARDGRPEHQWTIKDRPSMSIGDQAKTTAEGLQVLFSPWEAEQRIEALEEYDVAAVGSGPWMRQHESLEQLNLQAHQSAQQAGDEFVLEAFVTFDKLKVLVHELLAIEAWRLHVFPRVKRGLAETKCGMRAYFCLFHEATLVNLLAVCTHHAHAMEALGESAMELVDYLARRLVDLTVRGRQWASRGAEEADARALEKRKQAAAAAGGKSKTSEEEAKAEAEARATRLKREAEAAENQTALDSLEQQAEDVLVQVSAGAVTLVRYVCEHLNSLPMSAMSRVLDTHDLLCSLVPVLENPPWTRRLPLSNQWQKRDGDGQKWNDVANADLLTLTKIEGQVWIALFSLVCNAEVRRRYHFNSFRKAQLLRARKYLNEVLLDQLPVLADMQRFMDELALAEVPQPTAEQGGSSSLQMQQVGTVQEKLSKNRDWDQVCVVVLGPEGFGAQTDATDNDLRRLVDNVYGLDGVDDVLSPESEALKTELYMQPIGSLHVAALTCTGHVELCRVDYEPAPDSQAKAKAQVTPHGTFLRKRWVVPKAVLAQNNHKDSNGDKAGSSNPAEVPFSRPGDSQAVEAVFSALEGSANVSNEVDMGAAQAAAAAFHANNNSSNSSSSSGGEEAVVGSSAAAPASGPALPSMLKAELSFVGIVGPASVAVASESIPYPDDDNPQGPGGPFPRKIWVQLGAVKDKLAIQVQLVRASPEVPYRLGDAFVSAPAPSE